MYWNDLQLSGHTHGGQFNNNIRCIEICHTVSLIIPTPRFNNNIRCIEIFTVAVFTEEGQCLITT